MNAFSGLVKEMELRGAKNNGYELTEAVVTNLKPLSIMINRVNIGFNLVLNSSLILEEVKELDIEDARLKEALNKLYKAFKLEKGDRVLVKRVENTFYVLCKVGVYETI